MTYTAIYTQEPEWWYTVEILELPWCVSFGETIQEAEKMIKEAILLYKESQDAHKENFVVWKKFISSLQLS
jgi:predicted RNase H-like HicB family nuclease